MHRNWLKLRVWIQALATVFTNGYFKGFFTGRIFQGATKHICVPTLNCYSCPGALFSCPVGSVQAVVASSGGIDLSAAHTIRDRLIAIGTSTPLFIVGFLTIIGAFVGRATCGWVCPFGWFQELVYKAPTRKFTPPKIPRLLKYVLLVVFVVVLPIMWVDEFKMGEPSYCKYICPAGTLGGGIPLSLMNSDLRKQLGKLFAWKFFVLVAFVVAMVFFRRPFCAWACPLGAFFAPFNKVSLFRLSIDHDNCIKCGACDRACPAQLEVLKELDGLDCVRCFDCALVCPANVIKLEKPCLSGRNIGQRENPVDSCTPHLDQNVAD